MNASMGDSTSSPKNKQKKFKRTNKFGMQNFDIEGEGRNIHISK